MKRNNNKEQIDFYSIHLRDGVTPAYYIIILMLPSRYKRNTLQYLATYLQSTDLVSLLKVSTYCSLHVISGSVTKLNV